MSKAIERVYVAGPYTADPESCTRIAIHIGDQLLDAGYAPMIPHLSHYWHTFHNQRHYEDWMRLDLAWVSVADAVYRMHGASAGADRETALAEELGIPVVHSIDELRSLSPNPGEGIEATARRLVYGDRQADYGPPTEDFARTGRVWAGLLGLDEPITPETVAIMMAALKLSRLMQTPEHRDSQTDAIGYVLCLERVTEDRGQVA